MIIIHTDQQRNDTLGCCGNPHAVTPNIDAIAREGSVFHRHIAANTVCMPSRASLMTGLYPPAHNVWSNGVALKRRDHASGLCNCLRTRGVDSISGQMPTIADVFAEGGYHTAAFGKLHLTPFLSEENSHPEESFSTWKTGQLDDWDGPYYGFEHVEFVLGHGDGHKSSYGHYGKWLQEEHPDLVAEIMNGDIHSNHPKLKHHGLHSSPIPHDLHNSTWLASRFENYPGKIRGKEPQKRFFAFIGFPEPHHPFAPSHDTVDRFEGCPVKDLVDSDRRAGKSSSIISRFVEDAPGLSISDLNLAQRREFIRYTTAMIYQIDYAVGSVIQTLKDMDFWDNTITVVASDHNDFLGDHALLRKDMLASDSLLKIPLILRVPRRDMGKDITTPVSNCDVLPTLASLAGIDLPVELHGRDLFNLGDSDEEHVALAFCYNTINEFTNRKHDNFSVYSNRYRYTSYPHLQESELYDNETDPGELNNRAKDFSYQKAAAELKQILLEKHMLYSRPLLMREALY